MINNNNEMNVKAEKKKNSIVRIVYIQKKVISIVDK